MPNQQDKQAVFKLIGSGPGQFAILPRDAEIPEGWKSLKITGSEKELTEKIAELMKKVRRRAP